MTDVLDTAALRDVVADYAFWTDLWRGKVRHDPRERQYARIARNDSV